MRDWTGEIRRRLAGSGVDPETEETTVEEFAQHLEDRFEDLRSSGATEEEARRLALEELEEEGVLGRRVRQSRGRARPQPVPIGARTGAGWLAGVGGDLRFGARLLRRSPGFTIVAVLVITLGIGATTAVYSIIDTVLLRPLPGVRAPEGLAVIFTSDYSGPRFSASSYPDYEAIREEGGAFSDVAAHAPRPFSLAAGQWSERALGELVSANYFELLGVRPHLGRFFVAEEQAAGGTAAVAVISHDLWRRRFGGSDDAVGGAIRINGQMLTVVGVAPATFRGSLRGVRMDVWVPLSAPAAVIGFDPGRRTDRGLFLVGRLRPGTAVEEAQANLDFVARNLHAAFPPDWTDVNDQSRVLTVLPESAARVPQPVRGPVLGLLGLLAGMVGIVMLIACTNVANLMLARGAARGTEMGIRLALGATRRRIMAHLLTESILLATLGGTLGLLLAFGITRGLDGVPLPIPVPFALDLSLDLRVLVFATAATVLTGILFGIAPALQASRAPVALIRATGSRGAARTAVRSALVTVQVAASLVLLIGGGLFLRSLLASQRIDLGFDPRNTVAVPIDLQTEGYTQDEAERFYAEITARAVAIPGVRATTLAERLPLGLDWSRRSVGIEGYAPLPGEDMEVPYNGVGPDYFAVMGIGLRRGRDFAATDRDGAPPVVIVNEAFASRYWPGEDPIGKRVRLRGPDGPSAEVVGLAPDGKYRSLTEEPTPFIYHPYLQVPSGSMTLLLRTVGDPSTVVPGLRRELRDLAPGLPAPQVTTLREHVGVATLPQRIAAVLLGVLGFLALGIATVGLYGVVAYSVVQRTREFGIRMALGALASDVRRMVVTQGLRLGAIGIALGILVALPISRLIESFLIVGPVDPVTFVGVPLILVAASAAASYLSSRRATEVDPLTALRAE
jgi:predicted permease